MKSFKKLISFNNSKSKERRDSASHESPEPKQVLEEDSKEMQDLRTMRNRYEGLCAVSSQVAGRASDFSSAIQELASYFLDTFGSTEDGDMSKVFKIVGRVQSELAKILDIYATHVTETITEPTAFLLTELQNVQDSKKQHDEKRQLYEQLRARIAKGKPRNGKGEAFADQQLQVVKDEFDKLSTFVNTRLVSLEQGQARSLITQAVRHHTAQMHLFSRGHSSLQAIEPYMRQIARERNIERNLSSMMNGVNEPDDESDMKSDDDVSYIEEVDDSSDSQSLEQSNRWDSHVDTPGRSPNNQDEDTEVPRNLSKEWSSLLSKIRTSGENPHLRDGDTSGSAGPQSSNQDYNSGLHRIHGYSRSRSVPLSQQGLPVVEDTIQVTELLEESKLAQGLNYSAEPPRRLPPEAPTGTPRVGEGFNLSASSELGSRGLSSSGRMSVDRHRTDANKVISAAQSDSAVMPPKFGHESQSSSEASQAKYSASVHKHPGPMPLPIAVDNPPIISFFSPTLSSTPVGFTTNSKDSRGHLRRYSQSGPLTFSGTPWSGQTATGNISESEQSANSTDVHKSGPLGRSPLGFTFSSRISPTLSPPRMSPPRISELHKLPPPPLHPIATKAPRSAPIIAHSAPLGRYQDSGNNLLHATPLPPPPLGSVPRSLSLPSRQKQHRSRAPTIAQVPEMIEEESPASSPAQVGTNDKLSTRMNGSNFTPQGQDQPGHKRVSSGNIPGQETVSDLKFVHYNAAKSASGTPTLSSQHTRQPSPSARGGKEKAQQFDGRQAVSGSHSTSPLKSGGAQKPSRWRSLSINDKDNYLQSLTRTSAIPREFSRELVPL